MIDKLFLTFVFLLSLSLVWVWLGKGKEVTNETVKKVDTVFMYIFFVSFIGFVITGLLKIWL